MAETKKEKDKFLATARKRMNTAIEATQKNREYQLDDIRFAAGSPDNFWQWPEQLVTSRQQDPNGPRPVITVNKLPQHIRLVTNEQRQNRPSIRVIPVDDKGDKEVAEVFDGIIRHIQVHSDADLAYDTASENQVTIGEGYWRVLTEYCDETSFEQDIRISQVKNSFSVYMDPDGLRQDPTGRFCKWAFIVDEMSEDEFKAQFPDADPIDWELTATGDDFKFWYENRMVRVAEYFYTEPEKKTIYLWADGAASVEGDEQTELRLKVEKPIQTRETKFTRVRWCKMNGQEVIERNEWAGKFIPIIRCVGNEWEVDGEMVVSGLVRNAKDPQRMVNYWTSQEAEMLALAPKAPFVGAAGQFEGYEDKWKNANIKNYAYLEYNPLTEDGNLLPPPQRQLPPLPPAGIINAKLGSADDLQATVGQYDPSLGAEAQEKSGKAIVARQRQADVGTFHYIDNQAKAIRHTGRILVDLIPKIYDTKRIARILGEDGEPDTVTIDPDMPQAVMDVDDGQAIQKIYNPGVGKYDVTVTVGPSYTTKRQEAAEFMASVLQGNKELMAVMGDLYFGMLDVPGADAIAERIKKTLPPNLQDEDPDPKDLEARATQLQAAEQALQMKEQQLQEAIAMMQEKEGQAGDMEKRARDALAKVQAEVNKLNEVQSAIEQERELFALQQKLAQKEMEIQSMTLESEKRVAEAEVKTIKAELANKTAELRQASEVKAVEEKASGDTAKLIESVMAELENVKKLASAERELILDDAGEPIGSRPVLN